MIFVLVYSAYPWAPEVGVGQGGSCPPVKKVGGGGGGKTYFCPPQKTPPPPPPKKQKKNRKGVNMVCIFYPKERNNNKNLN